MASRHTFRGKIIPDIAYGGDSYLSLKTFKGVKGAARNNNMPYIVNKGTGPYIYGSNEDIMLFLTENNLGEIDASVQAEKKQGKPDAKPKKEPAPAAAVMNPAAVPEACPYIPQSEDVESVPDHVLENMSTFSFEGMCGRARVQRVCDGDTLVLLVSIDLGAMAQGYNVMKGRQSKKHLERKYSVLVNGKGVPFFTLLKVRLLGVDTAEHGTEQGDLATKLMIERYKELNNIVFYKLFGNDKYGRQLAELYADPEYTILLNDYLKNKQFGDAGVVALSYDGGKKSDYMKNLPKAN